MTATKGTAPAQSTTDQPPASVEEGASGSSIGLAELAGSLAAEATQRLGVVAHRCQTDLSKGIDRVDGTRSKSPRSPRKATPTPASRPHRYALEAWVMVKTASDEWVSPKDDSYSEDFVVDTVNLLYPGCTGAFLAEAGHVLIFLGKKNSPRAGLSQEESVTASLALREHKTWIGETARMRVQAISLTEVSAIVDSCKRMLKEDLRRARIELRKRVSSIQQASILPDATRTFAPVATSSGVTSGKTGKNHCRRDGIPTPRLLGRGSGGSQCNRLHQSVQEAG